MAYLANANVAEKTIFQHALPILSPAAIGRQQLPNGVELPVLQDLQELSNTTAWVGHGQVAQPLRIDGRHEVLDARARKVRSWSHRSFAGSDARTSVLVSTEHSSRLDPA